MENEKTQSIPENETQYQPMSIGDWIITGIIFAIPIIGFVMLFVWAFGSKTQPSKANWAKAALIFIGISIAIWLLCITLFFGSFLSNFSSKTDTRLENVAESIQQSKSNANKLESRKRTKETYESSKMPEAANINTSSEGNEECYKDVCLQLRNHDESTQSFEIYILNSIPVAGFQCDFPGINITGSDGGLLKENGYQTSNSASRILSFSMQAKLIPIGEGVLTTIFYSDPAEEVCMTEIIFAGMGGEQLSNNAPECMMLN